MRSWLVAGASTLALVGCASAPSAPKAQDPGPTQPSAAPAFPAPPAPAGAAVAVPISTTTDPRPSAPTLVLTSSALTLKNGDQEAVLVRAPADTTKGFDPSAKSHGPTDLYVNPIGEGVGALRRLHELVIVADASTANRTIAEILFTARRSRSPAPVRACLAVRSASSASSAQGDAHAICLAPFLVPTADSTVAPANLGGMNLRVQILPEGFAIGGMKGGFAAGCHGAGTGITVPKAGADYDYRGLNACLTTLKHEADGARAEQHITVGGRPDVPYQVIVSTIDAVRGTPSGEALFPDVILFDGGDDMLARFGDMGLGGATSVQTVANLSSFMDTVEVPPPSNSDKVIAALGPKLRACYDDGLKADPTMPGGSVVLRLKIAPDGTVESIGTVSTNGLSNAVAACVTGILRGARFEAPGPPGSTMQVPVSFTRRTT